MAFRKQFLRFTALLALTRTAAAQSGCFWRNGTENPSLDYSPCEAAHLSNICCSIRDVCLDNGLCRSNVGTYWRETCTSSSWNTGECQDLCSYNATQAATDQVVTPCDGTANSSIWCCGDSDSCCGQDSPVPRYTIARTFGAMVSSTASSARSSASAGRSSVIASSTFDSVTVSATSTTSTTSSPTATESDSSSGGSGLSTGAKAGVGVGATLGALALIGLGIFIAKAMRWRKKLRENKTPAPSVPSEAYGAPAVYQTEGTPVLELEHPISEKPGTVVYGKQSNVQELPASNER